MKYKFIWFMAIIVTAILYVRMAFAYDDYYSQENTRLIERLAERDRQDIANSYNQALNYMNSHNIAQDYYQARANDHYYEAENERNMRETQHEINRLHNESDPFRHAREEECDDER